MIRQLLAISALLLPGLALAAAPVIGTDETTFASASAAAATCTEPADAAPGQLFVSFVKMMDDAGHATKTFNTPSGWTRILQENSADAFGTRDSVHVIDYIVRGGSAIGDTTWTYDGGSTSGPIRCVIIRVTGQDGTTPFAPTYSNSLHVIDHVNAFTSNVYTGGSAKPATTVRDDSLFLIASFFTSASMTAVFVQPTGYTLDVEYTGTDRTFLLASKVVSATGTETPGPPAHENYADTIDIRDYTLVIQPAEGGAPSTRPVSVRRRM